MGTESWRKKESKRRSSERGKRRRINEGGGECDVDRTVQAIWG